LVGLGIGLALLHVSAILLAGGAAFAVLAGYAAIRIALPGPAADADPGWVVIDEIAGQMIALLTLHRIGFMGVALAFALFRLFDVVKPGPVGWADRQGGASGIMADDVVAGGLAALVLLAMQAAVPLS
jgi:phosphatidylglycerophosphatase A